MRSSQARASLTFCDEGAQGGGERKKRGRKAKDGYLSTAQQELVDMKARYDCEKKNLDARERAKRRNRISALESRINKRVAGDALKGELSNLRAKLGDLISIIEDTVDESNKK